jgi:hypothetical protein
MFFVSRFRVFKRETRGTRKKSRNANRDAPMTGSMSEPHQLEQLKRPTRLGHG